MIIEFCTIHKCTYSALDDGMMWGTLDISNGTYEGILGKVHGRKADLGYVGLYQWIEVNFYGDYSTSWLYGTAGLLVPKPVPLNPWRTPFLPFDLSIWLIILLSIIFSTLAFFFVSSLARKLFASLLPISTIGKFERLKRIAMAVFGVIVLQSPPRYLILNFSSIRILFISTEILALILTSVYAAELASYLTLPQ
ncbi:hypothetical protein O3M35_008508 [Rhynocoris fuscipes]|uniref:Ionotropic glutamate receptor C-terminal domain-containing protein n=1 Tax=Rhynocoris fuscipes TaxID=488301 RepID=A0AAW1D992_9HEMI